ncbi:hypothetical protein AAFF_G00402980 [Aldrovandia affinis]|uniref:Uncharacterized protein n=1 Tax=Aldrovandia affinis TaxID=143900 RepID=A0AAD7T795_9TELE|nr:hypothetical protein AAFF_G00402980 [Aldrovandia affinis]
MLGAVGSSVASVHCNLSQDGLDHQVCAEDVTSPLDDLPIDHGVGEDGDSPTYRDRREPIYQQVSEAEATQRLMTDGEDSMEELRALIEQAFPTPDQRASTVARILTEKWFYTYGIPKRIHSDQGGALKETC